jgi:hypothetical protein
MSESRVRENRMHGSMRRREAPRTSRLTPCGPRTPPADPTKRKRRRLAAPNNVAVTAEAPYRRKGGRSSASYAVASLCRCKFARGLGSRW